MAITGFDIEKFKANFKGGARSYLFMFRPVFPSSVISAVGMGTEQAQYLVRTANLPGTTIEPILVPWQGHDAKFAGKYTYADLPVTFNVDINSKIRLAFEYWQEYIHNSETNVYRLPSEYWQDQILYLLDNNGDPSMTYRIYDAWPTDVATVPVSYDANEIIQFDVTFAYQRHKSFEGNRVR
jgi:hypothetical protein